MFMFSFSLGYVVMVSLTAGVTHSPYRTVLGGCGPGGGVLECGLSGLGGLGDLDWVALLEVSLALSSRLMRNY
jgi:hypothetical protein